VGRRVLGRAGGIKFLDNGRSYTEAHLFNPTITGLKEFHTDDIDHQLEDKNVDEDTIHDFNQLNSEQSMMERTLTKE
jgi:hypothetical protein